MTCRICRLKDVQVPIQVYNRWSQSPSICCGGRSINIDVILKIMHISRLGFSLFTMVVLRQENETKNCTCKIKYLWVPNPDFMESMVNTLLW